MKTDVVKIDIDKRFDIARDLFFKLLKTYRRLREHLGLPDIVFWQLYPSASFHLHAVVWLESPVDCWERYMIARLLGDDPARSFLNLMRCLSGNDADILFFGKRRTSGP